MNLYLLLAAKYFSTFERTKSLFTFVLAKVKQKPQLRFSQNVIQAIFSSLKTRTPFGRPYGEAGFSKARKSLYFFFENIVDAIINSKFKIWILFSIYHLNFGF